MKSKIVALSKNDEFKQLIKMKKVSNKYVTIFFGDLGTNKNTNLNISFVTKKKLGNAVKRNQIKRKLRSISYIYKKIKLLNSKFSSGFKIHNYSFYF